MLDVSNSQLIAAHSATGGSPGRRLHILSGSPKGSDWIYDLQYQAKLGMATLAIGQLKMRELGACLVSFASEKEGLIILRQGKLERYQGDESPPADSVVPSAPSDKLR